MANYSYSNSKDIRLEDIESNISPSAEALLALIQHVDLSAAPVSVESKAAFQVFEKSLEHKRLRKILLTKLLQYSAGESTLQDIRQSNQDFRVKENARRRRVGIMEQYKVHENKDTSAEGKTTIYSCAKQQYVVAQYTSLIKEELFTSSIVRYSFKSQQITLLIQ